MNRTWSFIPLLCVAGLSVWLMVSAMQAGAANAYSYGFRGWLERWKSDAPAQLTAENLLTAQHLTDAMLTYAPKHPFYATLAAKQLEWKNYYDLVLNSADDQNLEFDQAVLEEARGLYLKAIQVRYLWPDLYVDLARNALQRGESAGQVFEYLSLAKFAAPHADETILGYMEMGLYLWPKLSRDQRIDTVHYSLFAMKRLRHRAEVLLSSPLRKKRGCSILKMASVKSKVCRQ